METSGNKSTDGYICKICNKNYKNRSGLWKHMIKCNNQIMEDLSENNKIIENLSENTKIIKNKDNKYKCKNCIKCFNTLQEVDKHVKTKCVPCVTHNNVFTFKTDTFGKNKYSKDNGEIFILYKQILV